MDSSYLFTRKFSAAILFASIQLHLMTISACRAQGHIENDDLIYVRNCKKPVISITSLRTLLLIVSSLLHNHAVIELRKNCFDSNMHNVIAAALPNIARERALGSFTDYRSQRTDN
jgi:heme/copper-type cytochrome/quinol oxidase subunit 3